jgi:hypothetical protein
MDLVQAGLAGIDTARKGTALPPVSIAPVWAPTAIGMAVGLSAVSLNRRRRSRYSMALGGLVGCAVGLGCGMAWASRGFTGALARGAVRKINIVRDERWLAENPINYA